MIEVVRDDPSPGHSRSLGLSFEANGDIEKALEVLVDEYESTMDSSVTKELERMLVSKEMDMEIGGRIWRRVVRRGGPLAGSNSLGEKFEPEFICIICYNAHRRCVIFPCRHLCSCLECGKKLETEQPMCPICRGDIDKLAEVFFS